MSDWRYYFPDRGESADDARIIRQRGPDYRKIFDAEDAAQIACELDFAIHDGWERGQEMFEIAVISPDGDEARFDAKHEPSVYHRVFERS